VICKNWLIHFSTLPQFLIFSHSNISSGDETIKMPYQFPNMLGVVRLAVVRHFGNYFAGFSIVTNNIFVGNDDELNIFNSKWRTRLFIGLKI
jgi:hypothetical protein